MVMEGVSPIAIYSENLVKICNKAKKDLDRNELVDNINQVDKVVDLFPKKIESLKAK